MEVHIVYKSEGSYEDYAETVVAVYAHYSDADAKRREVSREIYDAWITTALGYAAAVERRPSLSEDERAANEYDEISRNAEDVDVAREARNLARHLPSVRIDGIEYGRSIRTFAQTDRFEEIDIRGYPRKTPEGFNLPTPDRRVWIATVEVIGAE
jgi:hypothetical protein